VSFFAFFCVHNAAATRGQYLALSKAWWSCFIMRLSHALRWLRSLAAVQCAGTLCSVQWAADGRPQTCRYKACRYVCCLYSDQSAAWVNSTRDWCVSVADQSASSYESVGVATCPVKVYKYQLTLKTQAPTNCLIAVLLWCRLSSVY